MKEELLPVHYPRLPVPNEDISKRKEEFLQWEKDSQDAMEENDRRFKKVRKRIEWCAFLRGFLFFHNPHEHPHFSWCPYDEWMSGKQFPQYDYRQ